MGAVAFDIDALEGYAAFWLPDPIALGRDAIVQAFEDANYAPMTIDIGLRGALSSDSRSFVADVTGQQFEVLGQQAALSADGLLRARLEPSGALRLLKSTPSSE